MARLDILVVNGNDPDELEDIGVDPEASMAEIVRVLGQDRGYQTLGGLYRSDSDAYAFGADFAVQASASGMRELLFVIDPDDDDSVTAFAK